MDRIRNAANQFLAKGQRKSLALCALVSIAFTWWAVQGETRGKAETETQNDTFIPNGFVLVPIEVENFGSMEGLTGAYTIADLYVLAGGHPRLVASRMRMLRSPHNPSQFAVLTPENEVANLMSYTGPFRVVVQNSSLKTEQSSVEGRRRIVFERSN